VSAAALIAVAAWGMAILLGLSTGRPRTGRPTRPSDTRPPPRSIPSPRRLAKPAAVAAGAAVALVANPVAGLVAGGVLWWLLPELVARLDTADEARREAALAQQLPQAAGLLSACLASGAPLPRSLAVVAGAMADPARDVLMRAARTAELGGGPAELAAVLSQPRDPGWQAVGAAVVRASMTGAALADLLHDQAEQAATLWFAEAAARARAAAVRSVLPLALCYLPAFMLLGVAPLVASFLTGLALR